MAQPPDLEARVTALETQVSDLNQRVRRSAQDAAAARVLAGGADRDVTDIRTEVREFREHNTRVMNALRQDMNEGFARVDQGFTEMRGKLDAAAAGQQPITEMLSTLIAKDSGQPDSGQ